MPDQSNGYQLPSWPPTKIDRALWNGVMANLDARLKAREALEATFEILQEQGVQAALDYIQVSVAPQLSALQQSIANAQSAIDLILGGNAPNAQKLGGQLPSYYAKAQATAESLGALAVDISLLNTAIGKKLSKAGDFVSGALKFMYNYPELWWGNAATGTGWRIVKDTPEGQIGSLVFQNSNDRFAANFKTAMYLQENGEVYAPVTYVDTQLRIPNNAKDGGQFNGFLPGSGDGASYTTYNFTISGWWGMGMRTYDGTINGYYDFRAGIWDVKGGFKVNGNVVPHGGFKASAADIAAGTQNMFPDAAAVKSALEGFTSAQQTWSLSSALVLAHGLGVIPKNIICMFVVKQAQSGFAVGDRLIIPATAARDNNYTSGEGFGIQVDATNVRIMFGSDGINNAGKNGGAGGRFGPAFADIVVIARP